MVSRMKLTNHKTEFILDMKNFDVKKNISLFPPVVGKVTKNINTSNSADPKKN